MSPPALLTAGAIHVALLWLLLQYSPLQQAIRQVVVQYVQAVSPAPAPAPESRAITVRPPAVAAPAQSNTVFSKAPESSVPLQTTTQLPDTLQARKPVPGPRTKLPTPAVELPNVEPAPNPVSEAPAAPPEPPRPPEPAMVIPAPQPGRHGQRAVAARQAQRPAGRRHGRRRH
ncbi:MAG: hypothetical protein ABIR26_16190, partial [Ramlibacter sp.]